MRRPRLTPALPSPAALLRGASKLAPVGPQEAVDLTTRSLRGGWQLAARAYDLLSPVAVGPRVPGVARLLTAGSGEATGQPDDPAAGRTRAPADRPDQREARLADPILLLEGETGARVSTAFLVENERPDAVKASIRVSEFAAADGTTVTPPVTIVPPLLELEPGQQALVQVIAELSPELAAGVRYVAQISIPGLSDATVPIAARRRVADAA